VKMMKLALHRSMIFWSGLLVMGFIVWAWRDSLHHRCEAGWNALMGESEAACVIVTRRPDFGFRRVDWSSGRVDDRYQQRHWVVEVFPAPDLIRGMNYFDKSNPYGLKLEGQPSPSVLEMRARAMRKRQLDNWELQTPYWLLLLIVSCTWLALLAWRSHRRKKAQAAAAPAS